MKIIALIPALLVLCGCAATEVYPNANNIMVTNNPPPQTCKFLGQVIGNQGNFFTGGFTSNKNLEQGSMNDMKNQASQLGANYVQIITNRAGSTGEIDYSGGSFMQTNVTSTGNAFKCPPDSIGA